MKKTFLLLALVFCSGSTGFAQETEKELRQEIAELKNMIRDQRHNFDILDKKIEDVLWYESLGDVSYVDKVRLFGPPHHNPKPTGIEFYDQFLDNNMAFFGYTFIPKFVEHGKKYPLVVLVHGGIHGTFNTLMSHTVRELVAQGYIVIAPDYRGSIGYGKRMFENIDYGGLENEDALYSRNYMVDNYSIVDPERVAIVGWSHGGMIALNNICRYPDSYTCAMAGVPVSDVTYRLEYKGENYVKDFSADYHIGKTPQEAPEEYIRRSPTHYAKDLRKPLLINTTKNDNDVGWLEVKMMIDSLKHYGKDFEYEIYEPMPGAHVFERLDTGEATEVRYKTHKFLEKYMNPPYPFKSYGDMRKAGYRFE